VGQTESRSNRHRIAFVGPEDVGKTTVATMVANRLSERTSVEIAGEAATFFGEQPTAGGGVGPLGIHWTVQDHPAGPASLETVGGTLDTAFVVATPETLDRVAPYQRVADRLDLDVFLVVTRFEDSHRTRLGAFQGPELAEYFYENDTVSAAISAGKVPSLEDWTTEAILLESLQSERMDTAEAMAALASDRRRIVNVEVADESKARAVIRAFQRNGHAADFFECNCRCHEGHVVARARPFET
jgi:DNA polymerase III delta prime subunit